MAYKHEKHNSLTTSEHLIYNNKKRISQFFSTIFFSIPCILLYWAWLRVAQYTQHTRFRDGPDDLMKDPKYSLKLRGKIKKNNNKRL